MAEFCLDCWNKMNGNEISEIQYVLSKDLDLCEGCGEWKHVIIMERKTYYMRKFRYLTLPFIIIYNIIYFIFRFLMLPYLIFSYKKSKKNRNE